MNPQDQCTSTVDLGGPLRCTLPAGHTGWHRAESLQWGDQARGITQAEPTTKGTSHE